LESGFPELLVVENRPECSQGKAGTKHICRRKAHRDGCAQLLGKWHATDSQRVERRSDLAESRRIFWVLGQDVMDRRLVRILAEDRVRV
jgi:hypothetical protein